MPEEHNPDKTRGQFTIQHSFDEPIDLLLYDIKGRKVAQMLRQQRQSVTWQTKNITTGVYILHVRSKDKTYQQKLIITQL